MCVRIRTLAIIKNHLIKTLDLKLRQHITYFGISNSSSSSKMRWSPRALRVASKTASWKMGTRIAKKIKFTIAPWTTVETIEMNQDIQWGQFHSKNFSTSLGKITWIEKPREKKLKIIVKMIGLKVLSHNCYFIKKKGYLKPSSYVYCIIERIYINTYLGMRKQKVYALKRKQEGNHLCFVLVPDEERVEEKNGMFCHLYILYAGSTLLLLLSFFLLYKYQQQPYGSMVQPLPVK